jgi:hypothetical protein
LLGDLQGIWQSVHFREECQIFLSFLRLWLFLWSIAHHFGGSRVIYNAHDTQYMFERHDQKLVFLHFRAVFVSYCPLFLGSGDIYKEYDSLYILERNADFFCCFCVYGSFREL